MAWTKKALEKEIIREGESGAVYWHKVPNGRWFATGEDVNGKRIKREYEVNSRVDNKAIWSAWHDFNGRWGLTRLYQVDENGKRTLVWDTYGN